jgi:hypothetical protein
LKMLNVQELANVPLHSEKDAVCSNLVVIRKISPDSMSASPDGSRSWCSWRC